MERYSYITCDVIGSALNLGRGDEYEFNLTTCQKEMQFGPNFQVSYQRYSFWSFNPLTPELNPSTQRYLPRVLTGNLIFKGLTARRLYKPFGVKRLTAISSCPTTLLYMKMKKAPPTTCHLLCSRRCLLDQQQNAVCALWLPPPEQSTLPYGSI
jgi:hypothetical protein